MPTYFESNPLLLSDIQGSRKMVSLLLDIRQKQTSGVKITFNDYNNLCREIVNQYNFKSKIAGTPLNASLTPRLTGSHGAWDVGGSKIPYWQMHGGMTGTNALNLDFKRYLDKVLRETGLDAIRLAALSHHQRRFATGCGIARPTYTSEASSANNRIRGKIRQKKGH